MSNPITIANRVFGMPGVAIPSSTSLSECTPFLDPREAVRELFHSISYSEYPLRIKTRLESTIRDAIESGSDFEEIEALKRTANHAYKFAMNLPYDFPLPEISYDADFEVVMEWEARPRYWFMISISGNGEANFASILGASEIHGRFSVAEGISKSIFNMILEAAGRA